MAVESFAGFGVAVTGGGGHLGGEMALALAGAGAHVVICGRSEAPLAAIAAEAIRRKVAGTLAYEIADVSDDSSMARVIRRVEAISGGLRGWVNNAYTAGGGLLGSLTRAEVATAVSSLTDVITLTSAVGERMAAQGGGAIVNIASMYGVVSPDPRAYRQFPQFHNPPAYGAVKAGIIQFTRYAAVHLAARNVRVNAISPGPVPGPAAQRHPDFIAELEARIPMHRTGTPDEIADAVLYLLSDRSSFMTGQNLVIDGGWTAW